MNLRIAVFLGLTLGACQGEPEQTSTEGQIGRQSQTLVGGALTTDDPGVVAMARFGFSTCTGTLVAPQTILTAAHCVDGLGDDPEISIFFGSDINGEGLFVPAIKRATHPAWGNTLGTNDIGMVVINRAVNPEWIVPMNATPLTSDFIGAEYRHVGFGVFNIDAGAQEADGRKRTGTTPLSAFDDRQNLISGSSELSICFGDSGGPGFLTIDDQEVIAGVHSFTSSNCTGTGGDTRVDLHLDSLILPYIQENDPTCQANFVCAAGGCTSDPDCELCGAGDQCVECAGEPDPDCPDKAVGDLCSRAVQCPGESCIVWTDFTTRFCSEPCDPNNDSCPTGMSCQNIAALGNVCYYDEPPAGALGTDCSSDSDCATGLCSGSVCTYDCGPTSGRFCPGGFDCVQNEDFLSTCQSTGSGGCRTGSGTTPTMLLFIAGFLLAIRRKR